MVEIYSKFFFSTLTLIKGGLLLPVQDLGSTNQSDEGEANSLKQIPCICEPKVMPHSDNWSVRGKDKTFIGGWVKSQRF